VCACVCGCVCVCVCMFTCIYIYACNMSIHAHTFAHIYPCISARTIRKCIYIAVVFHSWSFLCFLKICADDYLIDHSIMFYLMDDQGPPPLLTSAPPTLFSVSTFFLSLRGPFNLIFFLNECLCIVCVSLARSRSLPRYMSVCVCVCQRVCVKMRVGNCKIVKIFVLTIVFTVSR